jgi:hypothetical protein
VVKAAPAEALCAGIMATMGLERPTDDVALLVVRRSDDR